MSKCTITDISGDLFTAPDDISLAHCVSADLTMGAGIAVLIKYGMILYQLIPDLKFCNLNRRKYDRVIELKRQNVTTGGVAVLQHEKRFIYYLVTKDRSIHKPTYENLGRSLTAMRHHMVSPL